MSLNLKFDEQVNPTKQHTWRWYSLWIGLITALITLLLWKGDLFAGTRLRMNDVLFVPRDTMGAVVIVAIDDDSVAAYGRSVTDWPRSLHASLIDIISQADARVIAFDVLFDTPSDEDDILAEAITQARTTAHARTRVIMPIVGTQWGAIERAGITTYTHFLTPVTALEDVVEELGHTNTFPDADGTVRWQPFRIRTDDDINFSFGIVTYLTYLRIPSAGFSQVIQYDDSMLRLAGTHQIPVNRSGDILLNYFSHPGDGSFPVYSYQDVLEGEVDPAVFNDKIVLVGMLNSTGLTDTYYVPIGLWGEQMAGVEIHANLIEMLLQNKPLSPQGETSQILLLVIFSLLSSQLYRAFRQHWYWSVLILISLVLVWFLSVFLIFNMRQYVLNLFDPLLALMIPAPITLSLHAVQESRRRRQAELLLGSIVTASSQRLSLTRILPGIADDLHRILKCDSVEFWLWNDENQQLEPTLTTSKDNEQHQTLAQRALQTNTKIREANRLAVPLTWQSVPLGALVAVLLPGRLKRNTSTMLDLFTWQTSSIIANVIQHREIQSLSDLKTRMIRMASHDLKNPLSVVKTYLYLLSESYKENTTLPQNHIKFFETMDRASDNMLSIINEILSLERVRHGVQAIKDYDLPTLLKKVILDHQFGLDQNEHIFTAEIPEKFPPLGGDSAQIQEAFSNLLGNAIKYTPHGGKITLRLTQTDKLARVSIEDTGYGISVEAQTQLFQEFFRARTPGTEDIEGTGLGLSLVKTVIETHKGRVWVESTVGIGSTFYVELPFVNDSTTQ